MAPVKVQDYILVHELAHLIEQKHSEKFWNIIGTTLPDYKRRKEWLRDNQSDLYF